jgi:hypothetical protein
MSKTDGLLRVSEDGRMVVFKNFVKRASCAFFCDNETIRNFLETYNGFLTVCSALYAMLNRIEIADQDICRQKHTICIGILDATKIYLESNFIGTKAFVAESIRMIDKQVKDEEARSVGFKIAKKVPQTLFSLEAFDALKEKKDNKSTIQ